MPFLLAILISAGLFTGFLLFTLLERKFGMRLLAGPRTTLDRQVSRLAFIVRHIDFGKFFLHIVRTVVGTITHDVVAVVLRAVRSFDRFLSSIVHRLRKPKDESLAPGTGSRFVKTMSYFKKNLQNPHAPQTQVDATTPAVE